MEDGVPGRTEKTVEDTGPGPSHYQTQEPEIEVDRAPDPTPQQSQLSNRQVKMSAAGAAM